MNKFSEDSLIGDEKKPSESKPYHTPVMVDEVLEYLNLKDNGVYIDVTFGGGGHTRAILEKNKTCRVIALDWDLCSIDSPGEDAKAEFGDRLTLLWGNFASLEKILKRAGITEKVDGILADFGTSSFQLENRPGFSFSSDTFLDMRMSPSFQKITAAEVVNRADEKELKYIFQTYGEEQMSAQVARAIVEERRKERIRTTKQLATIICKIIPRFKRKIHPATKIFQALRIYVNGELKNISVFLKATLPFLNDGGRLVCISFHSLEDRLVKQFIRLQKEVYAEKVSVLTSHVVVPTQREIENNPSSRSAKLRSAEFNIGEESKSV